MNRDMRLAFLGAIAVILLPAGCAFELDFAVADYALDGR